MIYLSRQVHFCAAHKLYNPKWTKEKNEDVFGACANENWHGHNFDMVVTVKGEPDPETGFVMNFKDLSKVIKEKILMKVDHKNLNLDVDFMAGQLTTCENLVVAFWEILQPIIPKINPKAQLHSIRLFETPRNFAEYFGD
ncbi:MAG: 6-pyruvoyl trahydropterin synthase family protein [Candidatus Cyclobacteriaceae bacterium M3_2C_046]